ncbi:MAG: amino acid permease [Ignavibacteriae bacterium HGW-Ignavibacteriae-2]|jgi:amino acid transporter/mannitol/fructose-specific phosphotransferase system IIA component (Ntr-type)|nr:MAG: amino acid permease [Ignavibacteriae bacterium HGW-Ignavibacteriae-2]
MAKLRSGKRLKKELGLFNVFAIATGSTVAGGFFLLPGLAAESAGTSFILAYVLAAILLIPSVMSNIELSTAMPRAGGVYYFLDRSMGPLMGTIGGLGVWLILILKVCFALIGISAYVSLFFPQLEITTLALVIAVILGIINLFGAKKSGMLQDVIVTITLFILFFFIAGGIPKISFDRFSGILDFDTSSIFATAGLVFVSYIGVTKVASLSEEIKNPERNIPLSIFLAIGTAFVIYLLGTIIMIGLVPIEQLAGNLTPAAITVELIFGEVGVVVISLAAFFAFTSVANAGILSASRYPWAMSRDHIFPNYFGKLNTSGTPTTSIITTTVIIMATIVTFDAMKIAKLASAFQLLIFALLSIAVMVMRESKINSYDPGFKSPFYPWMQIIGTLTSLWLIYEIGLLASLFAIGLIIIGVIWYFYYAKNRVTRNGAIYHIFERLGRLRYDELDSELRGILKEKGLRKGDPFDDIVLRSKVFELNQEMHFETVVEKAAVWLNTILPINAEQIIQQIMEGTRMGATPVTHGVALPHFRVENIDHPEMVLVRSAPGVKVCIYNPLTHEQEGEETVHAIFFLISPENNPTQHLRILAQIAGRVDDKTFQDDWNSAKDEQELKEALLHDEGFYSFVIRDNSPSEVLIGKSLREIELPENSLVALLRRADNIIVPTGKTILQNFDRLTIIGSQSSITVIRNEFSDKNESK